MKKTLAWRLYNFGKKKLMFYILTFLNYIIPKSDKIIYLFDRRFRKDNTWAFANYLDKTDQMERYKIYYYTKADPDFCKIKVVPNPLKAVWLQLRSKYVFYSYRDFPHFKPVKNQFVIDTMHGSPLKKIGYRGRSKFEKLWEYEKTFSHILCQSEFFKRIIQECFGANDEQCVILGYPRNDVIFKGKKVIHRLGIQQQEFKKITLWMPTHRSYGDLPVINDENITDFDEFLRQNNMLLIIKPHPNQASLDFLHKKYNNIVILWNEDLNKADIELYQLFHDVDALMTDYSSVYFDFLLTLKPIGFAIGDLELYRERQGFVVSAPLDLMPGAKIHSIGDLLQFFRDLVEENDDYYEQRKRINDLANKFQDGNSSKRLAEFLGL